ncbi:MAG: phosphomannomutase/phosphoglucomutase [Candidatus Marinimicrobia bacterium]|nr:phosphomannomutase/phosphoglucomutase [Candidatus Neomarinimicrobiota bacterium]
MNPYIFREYDIRGVVEKDFTDEVVVNLGKAFGSYVIEKGGSRIVISGDVRISTPRLKELFTEGLLSTGVNVIDVGIVPTPVNYYSMFVLQVDGAVQITGSHNPSDMNGFKMSYDKKAVYGKDIQYLRELIEKGSFRTGKGSFQKKEILQDYINYIVSKVKLERKLKVAMDCGNGTAGLAAPEIFKKIGCGLKELFCEIDGTFPNHHPDPTVLSNLKWLIDEIKKCDYDFGVAYDGDADRIGVVDDKGNIIFADYIMILFLDEVIKKSGETIVFDVKCSQVLEDQIKRLGGKPFMWKTGHSLIKEKMRELRVPFAGEMSGHIFFADDYFGYDDAIYVSARFAQKVSRLDKKLSEKLKEYPHYYSTPEMRLECPDDKTKFEIAKKAHDYFMKNYDCIDVDGVRIKFKDGWGLVRASNTQPVIVTRFEAISEGRLNEIKELVLNKLKEFGEIKISE